MKRVLKAAMLLLSTLASLSRVAQPAPAIQEGGDSVSAVPGRFYPVTPVVPAASGLRLTARVEKSRVEVGEPLRLKVGITNISPQVQSFDDSSPMTGFTLTLRGANGQDVPKTKFGQGELSEFRAFAAFVQRTVVLRPAAQTHYEFALDQLFDLTLAGRYSLSLKRVLSLRIGEEWHQRSVNSAPLSFDVDEPRAASEAWRQQEATAPAPREEAYLLHGGPIRAYNVESDGQLWLDQSLKPTIAGNTARTIADPGRPLMLAHSNGRFIYVVHPQERNIAGFRRASDGSLSPFSQRPVPLEVYPSAVVLDALGRFLYVAGGEKNTIFPFRIETNGALTALKAVPVARGIVSNSWPRLSIDPRGRFLYLLHDVQFRIYGFKIQPDGALQPMQPASFKTPYSPAAMAIELGGHFAYAPLNVQTLKGKHLMAQFRVGDDGALSLLNPPTVEVADWCHSVAVHPNGRFVYTVGDGNYSAPGRVSQFRIGPDGALQNLEPSQVARVQGSGIVMGNSTSQSAPLATVETQAYYNGETPRVVISPSGRFLYATGSTLSTFQVGDDGALSSSDARTGWGDNTAGDLVLLPAMARPVNADAPPLELELEHTVRAARQPVILNIVLRNTTRHDLQLPALNILRDLHFSVRHAWTETTAEKWLDSISLTRYGKALQAKPGVEAMTLAPGQELRYGLVLSRAFDFSVGGVYTVQVAAALPVGGQTLRLQSNSVRLKQL